MRNSHDFARPDEDVASTSSRGTDAASEASEGGELFVSHDVSKFDTLAGIAIKYNVTVADIKRANGLHSDSAMFARGVLRIPTSHLPAGHISLVGKNRTAISSSAPTSSAMEKLRGYYGLAPLDGAPCASKLGGSKGSTPERGMARTGSYGALDDPGMGTGSGRGGEIELSSRMAGGLSISQAPEGTNGRAGTSNGKNPALDNERLTRRGGGSGGFPPPGPPSGGGTPSGSSRDYGPEGLGMGGAGGGAGGGAMGGPAPVDFVDRPSLFSNKSGGVGSSLAGLLGGGGGGGRGGSGGVPGVPKRGLFDRIKASASASALAPVSIGIGSSNSPRGGGGGGGGMGVGFLGRGPSLDGPGGGKGGGPKGGKKAD